MFGRHESKLIMVIGFQFPPLTLNSCTTNVGFVVPLLRNNGEKKSEVMIVTTLLGTRGKGKLIGLLYGT